MAGNTDGEWLKRYLAMLGLEREAPSEEALARLSAAHLARVPFENVTSLIRRQSAPDGPVPPVDVETSLQAWEQRSGGGVCFDVTEMVLNLLLALGYEAYPVLGQITFPGSHQAVLVRLGGRRVLVDLGCGAPLFDPIPLDGPFEVHRAGLGYRFRPGDEPDTWVQDRQLGEWTPFCRYTLRPATEEEREVAYQRHHTPGEGWVLGSVTLVRCSPDVVIQMRDGQFNRFDAEGKHTEQFSGVETYQRYAAERFGLPNLPIARGLEAYASINGRSL
jgi:N-hydroxyarylamine O-acetyltransferase